MIQNRKTMNTIDETKNIFFGKINQIQKPLAR